MDDRKGDFARIGEVSFRFAQGLSRFKPNLLTAFGILVKKPGQVAKLFFCIVFKSVIVRFRVFRVGEVCDLSRFRIDEFARSSAADPDNRLFFLHDHDVIDAFLAGKGIAYILQVAENVFLPVQ